MHVFLMNETHFSTKINYKSSNLIVVSHHSIFLVLIQTFRLSIFLNLEYWFSFLTIDKIILHEVHEEVYAPAELFQVELNSKHPDVDEIDNI